MAIVKLNDEEQDALNDLMEAGLSDEEILRAVCQERGMTEQEFNQLLARCGSLEVLAEYLDNEEAKRSLS